MALAKRVGGIFRGGAAAWGKSGLSQLFCTERSGRVERSEGPVFHNGPTFPGDSQRTQGDGDFELAGIPKTRKYDCCQAEFAGLASHRGGWLVCRTDNAQSFR